jgi:hypothetical protein
MKRTLLLTVSAILLTATSARLQDTLVLHILNATPDNIQLLFKGNPVGADDSLFLSGSRWFFEVKNPAGIDVKIKIQRNQGFVFQWIPGISKVYPVRGDTLQLPDGKALFLTRSTSFAVVKNDDQVKNFTVDIFSRSSPRTPPSSANADVREPLIPYGSIFYDARKLADPAVSDQIKQEILCFHARTNIHGLEQALKGNRFLWPLVLTIKNAPDIAVSQGMLEGLNTLPAAIGGLDVTNIADGFARFIVKRAKTELNTAFFEKFRKTISDSSFRDFQTLFPRTYITFTVIGDRIYQYDAYIQMLRESFEADLRTLPANLPTIIANHPAFFAERPDLKAFLESSFYLAQGLINDIHPGDLLANFPVEKLEDSSLINMKGSIMTLQLFSESLRNPAGEDKERTYWVTEGEVRTLLSDATFTRMYLGLVRQRAVNAPYDSIPFRGKTTTNLVRAMDSVNPDRLSEWHQSYRDYLTGFVTKASLINRLIPALKNPVSDSVRYAQYYTFISTSTDLIEQCLNAGSLPGLSFLTIKTDLKPAFEVVRAVSSAGLDVTRRNYSSAISNVLYVYRIIFVNNKNAIGQLDAAPAEKCIDVSATFDNLFRFGSFMASIVQAGSSEEIAHALESAAMPAGSSRIKKYASINVCLNAYVGPYLGFEQIRGYDPPTFTLNSYGLTAPIGVAFSTGFSGMSASAFLSLIDIGAVASFRFANDSVAQVPTIQLADIVSPGLFFSFGLPSVPISVNLGAQMGPNLRQVTTEENNYANSVYFRYSISVVVDIPLFNFYTKSR